MGLQRVVLTTFVAAMCCLFISWTNVPADSVGNELKKQQAFLDTINKVFYPDKVRQQIEQTIRVGDEFVWHREFLGLAHETRYLPYLRQFQFLYYRGGKAEEGRWKIEVLVNEDLKVQRVSVQTIKR